MPRLKKNDVSIREVLQLSYQYYKDFDNKYYRQKVDVKRLYIINRVNHAYDRKLRRWVQTGREMKITFRVVSEPTSYKKIDTIKKHMYPVTFLIRDMKQGLDSSFRWRTGSLKKPQFPKKYKFKAKNDKEKEKRRKERIDVANQNIRNGVQLDFFFNLEAVLQSYGLLYGVNYATYLPKDSTNTDHIPYFDKTALFIVKNYLLLFISNAKKLST
jgi:hypothetical protein